MLDRNINSIIYQSYIKLGEYTHKLAIDAKAGLEGTAAHNKLWNKTIYMNEILETVGNHIEVVGNSVYRIRGITEQEMNTLLACLKEAAKITDYPIAPWLPWQVVKLTTGAAAQGPPGAPGASAYIAVAYAEDNLGTGFSSLPNVNTTHFAFKSSNQPIPYVPATFAGLWIEIPNNPGQDGEDGEDGVSSYTYIRYANDELGTNFSNLPSPSRRYVAFLTSPVDLGGSPPASTFTGYWNEYVGQDGNDGEDGEDGNTIICGSGTPDNAIGNNGDVYLDTTNWVIFAPKANDVWPLGKQLVGPPGTPGAPGAPGTPGAAGDDAYFYIAWADDPVGNGFTMIFDPNKDWIATKNTTVEIPAPIVTDFTGLWAKYRGSGDRWSTSSTTSITISTGTKAFIVENGLAYVTGQRYVMAQNGVPGNRMEGYVIDYNITNGQFTGEVTDIYGSGTFNVWDVSIQGAPSQVLTADSYYAEITVSGNSGGTPQSLTTSPTKITQFLALGDVSGGMSADFAADTITSGVVGEFFAYVNLTITGTASAGYYVQVFKNGVAITKLKRFVYSNAANNPVTVDIHGLISVLPSDIFELQVAAVTGTPNFLVTEGTFGLFTTGTPAAPEFTEFGGPDFDIGTDVVVDSFDADDFGDAVVWEYKIKKGDNRRTGTVHAIWTSLGALNKKISDVVELGTVDVVLDVDVSAGNVRLKADITSNDWAITGIRRIL